MKFESGVTGYVEAMATIKVYFPIDANGRPFINCDICPYLSNNNRICQLNKSVVAFPQKYVGQNCPLETKEEGVFNNAKI